MSTPLWIHGVVSRCLDAVERHVRALPTMTEKTEALSDENMANGYAVVALVGVLELVETERTRPWFGAARTGVSS